MTKGCDCDIQFVLSILRQIIIPLMPLGDTYDNLNLTCIQVPLQY